VHCVESLIAHARGDDRGQLLAVERYISSSDGCQSSDLAFGRSGLLVGCAILAEALPRDVDSTSLRSFGERLLHSIVSQPLFEAPIIDSAQMTAVGAAHGWSGLLFAVLRWCEVSGAAPPAKVREHLEELAALGQPSGRGLRWPRKTNGPIDDSLLVASWCNGAAGQALLWTLAARLWDDGGFDGLADLAAWTAYEEAADAPGDLCCGLAGRAYALLCRYRHTGEQRWLARARTLAGRAMARPLRHAHLSNSLYHGDVGIALLTADILAPNFARMPLIEAEGWLEASA
jgi:lantibiotic modifying enzyme